MLVEEVYLKHRPISYQYTAIDWVAVSTEVFFAIIWIAVLLSPFLFSKKKNHRR